jgi:predicted acyltransferase
VCYWLVDVRGRRRWAMPFAWFGMTAIFAFFLSGVMARLLYLIKIDGRTIKEVIFAGAFDSWLPAHDASLAFALCFVALWTAIVWAMHRRRWYWKV